MTSPKDLIGQRVTITVCPMCDAYHRGSAIPVGSPCDAYGMCDTDHDVSEDIIGDASHVAGVPLLDLERWLPHRHVSVGEHTATTAETDRVSKIPDP